MSEARAASGGGFIANLGKIYGGYTGGFIVFTLVAVVAHFLAWQWRPWLPGEGGYAMLIDDVKNMAAAYTAVAFSA